MYGVALVLMLLFESNMQTRNFARSTLRGCSAEMRKDKGTRHPPGPLWGRSRLPLLPLLGNSLP